MSCDGIAPSATVADGETPAGAPTFQVRVGDTDRDEEFLRAGDANLWKSRRNHTGHKKSWQGSISVRQSRGMVQIRAQTAYGGCTCKVLLLSPGNGSSQEVHKSLARH